MNSKIMVAFLVVFAAIGSAQQRESMSDYIPKGKVIVMSSPIGVPRSLEQLVRMSQLIVRGTVTSVLPAVHIDAQSSSTAVETRSLVAVDEVLKGSVKNNAGVVLLTQTGGSVDGLEVVNGDDPLVAEGERYVLFLMDDEISQKRPNDSGVSRYCVIGIWSGKAKIVDGKMLFAAAAAPGLHEHDRMDVDAFVRLVKEKNGTVVRPQADLPIHPGGKKQ